MKLLYNDSSKYLTKVSTIIQSQRFYSHHRDQTALASTSLATVRFCRSKVLLPNTNTLADINKCNWITEITDLLSSIIYVDGGR